MQKQQTGNQNAQLLAAEILQNRTGHGADGRLALYSLGICDLVTFHCTPIPDNYVHPADQNQPVRSITIRGEVMPILCVQFRLSERPRLMEAKKCTGEEDSPLDFLSFCLPHLYEASKQRYESLVNKPTNTESDRPTQSQTRFLLKNAAISGTEKSEKLQKE